jgi:hypothetical protein
LLIRFLKITRTSIRIPNVDIDRMPLPIDTCTTWLILKNGNDVFVRDTGFFFFAEGSECVTALKEGRTHAELGDTEGEEFESGGVGEAGGGGVLFVFGGGDGSVVSLCVLLMFS